MNNKKKKKIIVICQWEETEWNENDVDRNKRYCVLIYTKRFYIYKFTDSYLAKHVTYSPLCRRYPLTPWRGASTRRAMLLLTQHPNTPFKVSKPHVRDPIPSLYQNYQRTRESKSAVSFIQTQFITQNCVAHFVVQREISHVLSHDSRRELDDAWINL